MAWQTPVTNRTSASYGNYTDANRIEGNSEYIENRINTELGGSLSLSFKTDWDITDYPVYSQINRIASNIVTLKDALSEPIGWADLKVDWSAWVDVGPGIGFDFQDMNDMENNLLLLDQVIDNILKSIPYCGSIYAGQDGTYLYEYQI